MGVTCGCGRAIEQPAGPGRRRTKCRICSPPDRRNRSIRDLGPAFYAASQVTPELPPLVAVTRAELTKAGREMTPEGIVVLTLAAQIAAGGGSAAGLAALVREFHASKARALEGTTPTADVIDGIFGATG